MARRKTKKSQLPEDLTIIERVALRIAPPSGLDQRVRPNNNRAKREWMDYKILLFLHDRRFADTFQLAYVLCLGEGMLNSRIALLEQYKAVKRVRTRADAKRHGIEYYRLVRPCYVLTHKAKQAIAHTNKEAVAV